MIGYAAGRCGTDRSGTCPASRSRTAVSSSLGEAAQCSSSRSWCGRPRPRSSTRTCSPRGTWGKAGRALPVVGTVAGIGTAAWDQWRVDASNPNRTTTDRVGRSAGVGIYVGGAAAGGAAIGTMLFPGVGTLAGAGIGAAGGLVAGAVAVSIEPARELAATPGNGPRTPQSTPGTGAATDSKTSARPSTTSCRTSTCPTSTRSDGQCQAVASLSHRARVRHRSARRGGADRGARHAAHGQAAGGGVRVPVSLELTGRRRAAAGRARLRRVLRGLARGGEAHVSPLAPARPRDYAEVSDQPAVRTLATYRAARDSGVDFGPPHAVRDGRAVAARRRTDGMDRERVPARRPNTGSSGRRSPKRDLALHQVTP